MFLRGFFTALLSIFFCAVPPAFPETRAVEEGAVLRQDISVTLVPEKHLVRGETTLTYAPGTAQGVLLLAPSAQIDAVSAGPRKIPYRFREGVLSLDFPLSAAKPSVTISYHAVFNDEVAEHPASSEDPSYGVNGAITQRGTFLGSGAGWYPAPAKTPAARSLRVEAPSGTEAISAGHRAWRENKDGVTRSLWVEDHPMGELALSAGPYQILEGGEGRVAIYIYFYPDNAVLAPRYLEAASRYIRFYSELFGPYPFEKFAAVENFFPTGYAFPSYTLLGSTVIRLPFIINTSFPHEIAHSWWGNAIEPDFRRGNWSEALVTYVADYLLREKKSEQEGREYRMQLLADYATLVRPERDFPLLRFTSRVDPASRAIGYGKGAMLFHMIRRKIGDHPFFDALKEVSREHLYGVATWDDFVGAFSRSSGVDLAPFVGQWLERAGGPHLALDGVGAAKSAKGGFTVTGSVLQGASEYRMDVPLRLETSEGVVRAVAAVAAQRSFFDIKAAAPPKRLALDPDAEVFRVLSEGELPLTVNRVKGGKRVVALLAKGCRARPEEVQFLLESLEHREAAVVPEKEADEAALAGSDLVICGTPSRKFLSRLPAGVTLSDTGFTLQGKSYGAEDDLLFLVTENPFDRERVAAFFLPLSERAAGKYLPKITHYGKYGLLVFSGGENKEKGTSPPPAGPTVVDLP